MVILDLEQRSDQWFQARLGIPTSSNFSKIVKTNGERSSQRKKYLYKLAGEIVSQKSEESFKSAYMERGT